MIIKELNNNSPNISTLFPSSLNQNKDLPELPLNENKDLPELPLNENKDFPLNENKDNDQKYS
jgi:hypothetical protein